MEAKLMDQMNSLEDKHEHYEEQCEYWQCELEHEDRIQLLWQQQHQQQLPQLNVLPSQPLLPYYSLLTPLNPPPSAPPQAPHPTYIPPHTANLSPPLRAAASSPISTQIEDADILAGFFKWKLHMTKNN